MASRSLLFSTPLRGLPAPVSLAGNRLENSLTGTTDENQISSCARSWRPFMATLDSGPAEDAPNWTAAYTLVQSPNRSVNPSVNNAMQTLATGEFMPGWAISIRSTPGRRVLVPPFFNTFTSMVGMLWLNVPCAAINQCPLVFGAPFQAATTSVTSERGSMPVSVINPCRYFSPIGI